MINIFNEISKIEIVLKDLIELKKIKEFKIVLRINNLIELYILNSNNNDDVNLKNYQTKIRINYIHDTELIDDDYLNDLFENKKNIILDSKRNLNSLLSNYNSERVSRKAKIVTFYSYKGGVGRSTTLASCASYLAKHESKKIVIIDCDFEAPGFTNFYLNHPNEINFQNGFVEFLLDKSENNEILVSDYCNEVGVDFAGDGSIFVMQAGNLSEDVISKIEEISTHKNQYLNGLARLQFSNKTEFENQFSNLVKEIEKEIAPDLIFIDSRTGFNDVFGLTALNFSDLVIGFFGDNVQTLPGLNFFIEKVGFSENNVNSIIVNSIISNRSSFNKFQQKLDNKVLEMNLLKEDEENQISIKSFPIVRYTPLESIGVTEDSKDEFIDLIENKRFPEYNLLFDYIYSIITEDTKSQLTEESELKPESVQNNKSFYEILSAKTDKIINSNLFEANNLIKGFDIDDNINVQRSLKKHIKSKLRDSYPKLYGEHSSNEMLKNIYYRKSMEDIFNHSKFILLGNKGTGKTFLYEALKIEDIVNKLKNKAQKKDNYVFFHLIDNSTGKFIDTLLFEDVDEENESFYHKFWVVYIWNSIMLESEIKLGFKSAYEVLPITNDSLTRRRFLEIIQNNDLFIKIELELKELDNYLKSSIKKQNLVVIFDGLDQIVKPSNWHYKIVPLINYWRHHSFSKISPKLFLRSDLFEKLSNITNVKELKNQSISIEWNQQELFAYFFKLIFKTSGDSFLKYMLFTRYNSYELIKQINQKSGDDNQIPLDEYYLKPMVEAFFGKFADSKNSPRFGESYEWFFRNLKNANNTISLRPFIDLLDSAIDYSNSSDNSKYPILPANYYVHGEARKDALTNHFDDLITEKGNEDLNVVCKYIREKKTNQPVFLNNTKSDFDKLLKEIIEFENTENTTVDQLINMLKLNGVISEHFSSKGVSYSFALLYKYFLGLKTK